MPRNVTVTLADGSQHTYANAPDDITPAAVTARAMKEFGQSVTALDGGRSAAPAGPPTPKNAFGLGAPPPKGTPERQAFDTEYNKRFNAAWLASHPQEAARRAQTARIQSSADARSQNNVSSTGNFLTAFKGGVTRGLFGIPERLAAAGEAYLPSAITGNTTNASYSQILDMIRKNTDADMNKSTSGNILGQVVGGVGAGRAAGGLVGAAGSRLAATGAPVLGRVGNFIQSLTTLNKGQKAANAAKIIAAGGAQGGAQAAGEGSDVTTGALAGATGAAALGGGFKAAQVITRPFRDFLRLSSSGKILSRLTSATTDQLSARADAYRAATGAEPTVFELLPLADRNKILKQAVVGRDSVVESASNAIRARANNLGPEMRARAQAILDPRRAQIQSSIADDLTNVGAPDAPQLAGRAVSDPTDLLEVRRQEANAIMAPHEDTPVVNNFNELLPTAPGPNGTLIDADPEVSRTIATVAGNIRARPANNPITAGEVSGMIEKLRGWIGRGGNESTAAENAIAHLEGVLGDNAPDAANAYRQMTDAYAARSRMAEGMSEGGKTRLRSDVDVGTSNTQARKVRNAYDTPEGAAGRTLGQGNRILGDLSGSPEDALKATVDISRSRSGRALAANLGTPEAEAIGMAARAQDESAQALAAASAKAGGNDGAAADAETLVSALAGLHPSGFITTKAGAIRKLIDMTYIPASRARTMVDMIFSQDPTMSARALRAIGNEPNGAAFIKRLAGVVGQLSNEAANAPETPDEQDTAASAALNPENVPSAAADIGDTETPTAEKPGDDPNVPYGHAVIASLFPTAEITSDVRSPDDPLSEKNPGSYHTKSQNAVDVRPIPGMTFAQFIGEINDAGHQVVEARDEATHPIPGLTTGPHWHVVVV